MASSVAGDRREFPIREAAFAEDEIILFSGAEWVTEVGDGLQVNFRVFSRGLTGGGACRENETENFVRKCKSHKMFESYAYLDLKFERNHLLHNEIYLLYLGSQG